MSDRIWITWENQRRNREMSKALKAKLYELKEIDSIKNPLRKYSTGLWKTILILIREKPKIVLCQNPSLILSSFIVSIRKIAGIRVCIDAHNAGLRPKEGRSHLLGFLSRYVQRKADLIIVTNEGMKSHVEQNLGRAFILPDKIPAIPHRNSKRLKGDFNILFICSFAEDEPYGMIFSAAKSLVPGIQIYVTGSYQKRGINPDALPKNIHLMGYISEDEYVEMLNAVDATIDLTNREDCLVCGAYESVAVEKPQILSDTEALKHYFSKGAVYCSNTVEGVLAAISELKKRKDSLQIEARGLKHELQISWEEKRKSLEKLLRTL